MHDNLPRHTLIRMTDGSVFLVKCQICEWHGMNEVCCYIGHRYRDESMLDYEPYTCYHNMIESIMEKP
jgi:hypothetical protein